MIPSSCQIPKFMGSGGNTGDDIQQRCDIVFNILRPCVRLLLEIFPQPMARKLEGLKCADDVIQKLTDPQHSEQLPDPKVLDNIAKNILGFLCFVDINFNSCSISLHSVDMEGSLMETGREDLARFFDSAIHILQHICNDEYIEKDPTNSWTSMKKEIAGSLDELEFLRYMLWEVNSQFNQYTPVHYIPAVLSFLLCTSFAPLVEVEKQGTHKFFRTFRNCFRMVRETINDHVRCLHRESHRSPARDDMDTPHKYIDQKVVEFLDRVISKLKVQCMSSDNQTETAIEELSYLKCNLLDVLQLYSEGGSGIKDMEALGVSTLALIADIAFPIYFHCPDEKAKHSLPHLIETVDSLKLRASNFFSGHTLCSLSSSSSGGPRNSLDTVSCLIKNIEELTNPREASVSLLKPQIETYYQEIQPLRKFLGSQIANDLVANTQMGFFIERFSELICKSGKITDSFLRGEGSIWYHKLGLFVITNEVKATNQKMKGYLKMTKTSIKSSLTLENPSEDMNAAVCSKNEMRAMNSIDNAARVKLVGVEDAAIEIIDLLTRGTASLKMVSIVGMPGLGKTTMANYVYDHRSVSLHFHVRAWCCASQAYNKETLLADLLSQVVGETKTSLEEVNGDDLAHMLYQKLKGKRYLIVVDDIWNTDVWTSLQGTFPEDGMQSRILFTTRRLAVAREANGVLYKLRLLSVTESCMLLWFKVFDIKNCPFPELLSTSRRIAKNCKGLPLAVALVAGILRKTERRKESWEAVAQKDISLHDKDGYQSDQIRFRSILELSYTSLPVELRPCFLYFAAFPKDTSISASKLMELWISEGFVHEQNICGKSLKEGAESYLDELIDRSLVMITKKSSNNGVKACHIHDVLQDFCFEKSREENLISREPMFGGIIHRCSFIYHNLPNQAFESGVHSEGRVFINSLDPRTGLHSEGANVRANKWITNDLYFDHKFLKVLDLGKVGIQNSADTSDIIMIATLVHLRFLGIRPRSNEIPAEIGNLLKLETLILTGVIGIVTLPESLWKLSRLRNILMDHGYFSFQHFSSVVFENFSHLGELKSVSTLSLHHGDDVENRVLRRLSNLHKLACRFVYSWNEAKGCCIFPVLDFLNQLKSLKLFFSGVMRNPCQFSFPSSSLKKLSLSNSRLPWDEISVIMEHLPNLEVLKLLNKAFEGQQWNMGNCEILFPKLKFLKLDSLDIQVWNAVDEPFPCLEQLLVLSCPHLEDIPSCFGEIPTLQSIEMKWCSLSAMDSVRQILRDQRDFSNHDLKVTLIGS